VITVDELAEPFSHLLDQLCTPATLRQAEAGIDDGSGWRTLLESGFLDAMVREADGGAGLAPVAVAPLFVACGQHLPPHPFAETLVARALASTQGKQLPTGPILLWPEDENGQLRSLVAPEAGAATHALVQRGSRVRLQCLASTSARPDGFRIVSAELGRKEPPLFTFELPPDQLMNWAAALTCAQMAGAMNRVLEMTLQHVNSRKQFDRPLAKFQAIQHQVSVMAERVASANVAARLALRRGLPGPNTMDAAVGKTIANTAATVVTAVAHATHGAIGITAEHDLSLFVRRLKRWQLSFGAAGYWTRLLGAARLESTRGTSVDFLRACRQ
jgi:acyl-CoA dehydrogenase